MPPLNYIGFVNFGIFLIVHIFYTQKIYSKNNFALLFSLSIVTLGLSYLFAKNEFKSDGIKMGFGILYYTIVLLLIKRIYRRLNEHLIKKSLVRPEYAGKDFTYVMWDSDIIAEWWNIKYAKSPSWLDHVLTSLLFFIPLTIVFISFNL